jgi:hypothetical protein
MKQVKPWAVAVAIGLLSTAFAGTASADWFQIEIDGETKTSSQCEGRNPANYTSSRRLLEEYKGVLDRAEQALSEAAKIAEKDTEALEEVMALVLVIKEEQVNNPVKAAILVEELARQKKRLKAIEERKDARTHERLEVGHSLVNIGWDLRLRGLHPDLCTDFIMMQSRLKEVLEKLEFKEFVYMNFERQAAKLVSDDGSQKVASEPIKPCGMYPWACAKVQTKSGTQVEAARPTETRSEDVPVKTKPVEIIPAKSDSLPVKAAEPKPGAPVEPTTTPVAERVCGEDMTRLCIDNHDPAPAPIITAPVPAPAPIITAPVPAPAPIITAPVPAPAPIITVPVPTPAPIITAPVPTPAPIITAPVPAPAPIITAPVPAPAPIITAPVPAPAPVITAPAPAPAPIICGEDLTRPCIYEPGAAPAPEPAQPTLQGNYEII